MRLKLFQKKIKIIRNSQEELAKIWNSNNEDDYATADEFDDLSVEYFNKLNKTLKNFKFWEVGRYDSP